MTLRATELMLTVKRIQPIAGQPVMQDKRSDSMCNKVAYRKPEPPNLLPKPVFAFLTMSFRLPESSWRPLTDRSRSRSQIPTFPSCLSLGSAALALECDWYSDSDRALF